uniref:Uncharacterized protein n=1 Tax=Triticum urartu TaxID=4572 RepID=A0A8R7TYW0_TRIUA
MSRCWVCSSDGHRATQSARHVSGSAARARRPAVAQLAAASDGPSRRRSAQASTSAGRSSTVVVGILPASPSADSAPTHYKPE